MSEEKKKFEPLDSISVVKLKEDIVGLIYAIDRDENCTCITLGDLVDGVIGKYIDLNQPTSPNDASWIETALEEALDIAEKDCIHVRPIYSMPTNSRRFQISINWKVYREVNEDVSKFIANGEILTDKEGKEYRVVGRYPEYRHNGISAMVVWPESPENVAALNDALDSKEKDQEE